MIVFKKHQMFFLVASMTVSFAGMAQENALSRRWQSVSDFVTKASQCPYTYHAAAPLALYAGYKVAPLIFKAANDMPETNPLLTFSATFLGTGAAIAAYYAPSCALTELMRKQRTSIVPQNNKPSKGHFFVPGFIQSLIISGFLLSNPIFSGTPKGILMTLSLASLFNPGIIGGTISFFKEYDAERPARIRASINQMRQRMAELESLDDDDNNNLSPSIAWQQEELRRIQEEEKQRLQNQCLKLQHDLHNQGCCSICLDDSNRSLQTTICNHKFHGSCLNTWLETNSTCPLCRAQIVH